jgi:predicted  nucleic acid-binding Zn-ribbon protein
LNDQIQLLVRLQKIAFSIFELEKQRKAGPQRLQHLEDQFQRTVEDIGAARLRFETLETERRELERQIEELEAKLEKYHQQLMSVTNAREYSAALNEIDAAKTARERAEEGILVRKIEEEELADAVTEADSRIADARASTDAEKERILTELSEVDGKLQSLAAEKTEVESVLDDELVLQFRRVFDARGGVAMARIDSAACSACHLRLRPQVINEVRKGDKLVPCDSCRRFLYVDEEESRLAQQQSADRDPTAEAPASDPSASESADRSMVAEGTTKAAAAGGDTV